MRGELDAVARDTAQLEHALQERAGAADVQAIRSREAEERLAGFVLMCAVVPMAVAGYLMLVWIGCFGPNHRGRAGVRALDHFVNATIFNGYAWESISSHA